MAARKFRKTKRNLPESRKATSAQSLKKKISLESAAPALFMQMKNASSRRLVWRHASSAKPRETCRKAARRPPAHSLQNNILIN